MPVLFLTRPRRTYRLRIIGCIYADQLCNGVPNRQFLVYCLMLLTSSMLATIIYICQSGQIRFIWLLLLLLVQIWHTFVVSLTSLNTKNPPVYSPCLRYMWHREKYCRETGVRSMSSGNCTQQLLPPGGRTNVHHRAWSMNEEGNSQEIKTRTDTSEN